MAALDLEVESGLGTPPGVGHLEYSPVSRKKLREKPIASRNNCEEE